MMRHVHHLLIAAALWGLAAGGVCAADVKVIANASVAVSSVSVDDLKSIFLATKTSFSDGRRVEPVLLKSGSAHEIFVKQYMGKTDTGLEMYYRSLVFTGKGSMPKSLASDAEMVDYVARTKGAIGYVSGAANTNKVRVLEVR